MDSELSKLMDELGMRMRLFRASQENGSESSDISEREILFLELLDNNGRMTISQIMAACPSVSESTVSTSISRLWRYKNLVSKNINPENQRVTFVELTDAGRSLLVSVRRSRAQRLAELFRAMEFTPEEAHIMETLTLRAINYFDEFLGLKKKEVSGV